jgi:uncharacterized protein (DUF697 family)/predicted GTPase
MFERVRHWWAERRERADAEYEARLAELRSRSPVPVFWLFGKTQSGKTSLVRCLTGASDAEIGTGFQPCTRFSRHYDFPNAETPLLRFLDTRGVDEPGYEPAADLAEFDSSAHVVLVTVKALDHAQENVLRHLQTIRQARPSRPVVLVLTCLHEGYPHQQHLEPFPFRPQAAREPLAVTEPSVQLTDLMRSLEEQRRRFSELVDFVIPVDLTRPMEGFVTPNYGGEALRELLMQILPEAQRETLRVVEEALADLKELHARKVLPTILGHALLAGSAGAIPLPFVSLLVLPRIQRRMIQQIAGQYGRPLTAEEFVEVAHRLGIGQLRAQAARELLKVVPYLGVVAAATGAGAATYALGKAFCHYDAALQSGEFPDPDELRRYYDSQVAEAKRVWSNGQASKRTVEVQP